MLINATLNVKSTESASNPKAKLVVNTSAFSDEDFNTYLYSCEKIENNEKRRISQVRQKRCLANTTEAVAVSASKSLIKATMTRKEIFECSTLEDDGDDINLPRTNISESISNLMKYFDEDIRVNTSISSSDNTPVKLPPVATVLEHFKNKASNLTTMMTFSPFKHHKRAQTIEIRPKIQELRKKYETASEQESERVPKIRINPQSDLKKKSLVQQITKLLRPTSPKSSPKKRSKRPSYRPQILPSPVPSPRSQRKHPTLRNNFLEAEEIFHQLSVKDKALLYARLFQENDNSKDLPQKKNPETRRRCNQLQGEKITEPQGTVKHLTQKLEAKLVNRYTSSGFDDSTKNTYLSENSHPGKQSQKSEFSEKSENGEEKEYQDVSNPFEPTNVEVRISEHIQKNLSRTKDDQIEEEPLKVETISCGSVAVEIYSKEFESDSSSIEKLSSDECELSKPLKSIRKKKVRRHLLSRKNLSSVELKDPLQTTDSDSDRKTVAKVTKNPIPLKELTIERDPSLEEDDKISSTPLCKNIKELQTNSDEHIKSLTSTNEEAELQSPIHLMVSYEDQGFETGSNELSTSCHLKPSNTFDCSTPIRGQTPQTITTTGDQARRNFNFSPIYVKSVGHSTDQSDEKRYSAVSQATNPEDPLSENQVTSSQEVISPNHATISIVDKNTEKTSVFWICIGDFAISIDICYNTPERLLCLYHMFTQKSSDAEEPTYFGIGIDDQVFSVTDSLLEQQQKTFKRIPLRENCSQYWFARGDVAVHFNGKFMSPEKAMHLLNFLHQVVSSSTYLPLHFGVDYIDFSKELWGRDMEFLKNSENVREDSKKHVSCTIKNASYMSSDIKTSDLDHSDFESDEWENKDTRRMVTFNVDKSDKHEEKSKTFTVKYEEPLREREHFNAADNGLIRTDEEDLTSSSNHSNASTLFSNFDLEKLKGSPQYFSKIQQIISAIHVISEETDFKNSSTAELENYAFYLSRYADICLDTCMEHLDKVLDVLNNRPATPINCD